MIINYDGKQYPFDIDGVTVKQALKIEKFMGCSYADWWEKLKVDDTRAKQAFGWLILHGGVTVPIEDTDFKLMELGNAFAEAVEAEIAASAPAADEPVPTVATSTGPMPDVAASSPVS